MEYVLCLVVRFIYLVDDCVFLFFNDILFSVNYLISWRNMFTLLLFLMTMKHDLKFFLFFLILPNCLRTHCFSNLSILTILIVICFLRALKPHYFSYTLMPNNSPPISLFRYDAWCVKCCRYSYRSQHHLANIFPQQWLARTNYSKLKCLAYFSSL